MEDFISFLTVAAFIVIAAVSKSKKEKAKQARKTLQHPTPAAPHRETMAEYMERQKRAAEERQKRIEEAQRRSRTAAEERLHREAEAEKQRKAAEEARKAEEARRAAEAKEMIDEEGMPSEEIADEIAKSAQAAAAKSAGEGKPLDFNPEEMVIYSEILAPKYEQY